MVDPVQGRPTLIRVHPSQRPKHLTGVPLPVEIRVLAAAQIFFRGLPLGGGGGAGGKGVHGGGVQVGRIPARGRSTIIGTHHPQEPKFS